MGKMSEEKGIRGKEMTCKGPTLSNSALRRKGKGEVGVRQIFLPKF